MRAFYAWAAHSSRRRKLAEEMRAQRRARGGSARAVRFGGFGAPPVDDAPPPAPLGLDVDIVVATLTERAEQVRSDARRRAGAAAGLQLVLARHRRHPRPALLLAPWSLAIVLSPARALGSSRWAGWTAWPGASRCSRPARPP